MAPPDVHSNPSNLISRRHAIEKLGFVAGGAFLLGACGPSDTGGLTKASKCPLRPTVADDSFFVDENLQRSDIRADTSSGVKRTGTDLTLSMTIYRNVNDDCTPLENVQVDVWHCDARGIYSDAIGPNYDTRGQNFLRGFQLTNQSGVVEFTTIVPGWELHRATHLSFKIRKVPDAPADYSFTSQFFFDEDFLSYVYMSPSYAGRNQTQRTVNGADLIYTQNGGIFLLLTPAQLSTGGFAVDMALGLVY